MVGTSRHRDVVALLGVFILVGVSVWIVRDVRNSGNDLATLYDTYLGVAALTVPLLAVLIQWWWKGRRAQTAPATAGQVMAAADQLAVGMLDTWRTEATERRISVPAPVRVRWQWGPADVTPLPAQLTTTPVVGTGPRPLPEPNPDEPNPDPAAVLLDAGVVTRLHDEVYRKLPHGRLVLLGEGGAGKTGAMILLLLAALEHRHRVPEAQRGQIPVPVWLTLGGWDPTTQTLRQWATATMYRDHPYLRAPDYGPDTAGELLRTGRVALFLDGLDEMAPATQHQALARVEQEVSGLRIVLSSRPNEYRNVIAGQRLHNAVVIEVQPVDPDEAGAYLLHDQIGPQYDRWAQVGDYLTQHPDSVAAQALDNPLSLSLARATYQDQDPTLLTDPARFPTVTALREHLINRILITAYPDDHQRAHATRWLAWIAHHMGPDRDLAWWRIHIWIPRWQPRLVLGLGSGLASGLAVGLADRLASGLTVGLTIGLVVGLASGLAGRLTGRFAGRLAAGLVGGLMFGLAGWLVGGLTVGLTFGLMGGLASGLTSRLMGGIGKRPQAIIPRRPRLRELPRLLASGLAIGLAGWLAAGMTFGLTAGFAVGLLFGLLDLWTVPLPRAPTGTPDTTYRMDRRTSTAGGLAIGFAGGLAFGLKFELTLGLAFGLTFGITGGLARGSAQMIWLIQFILMITGAGRVNLIKLLKDAHQRQVLRQAGAVYQFRHAEFQEHLAKIHHQRTRRLTST